MSLLWGCDYDLGEKAEAEAQIKTFRVWFSLVAFDPISSVFDDILSFVLFLNRISQYSGC